MACLWPAQPLKLLQLQAAAKIHAAMEALGLPRTMYVVVVVVVVVVACVCMLTRRRCVAVASACIAFVCVCVCARARAANVRLATCPQANILR